MKLTVINNEVIFDYSGINTSALITNPDRLKASQVREFLRNTSCDWEFTDKTQVMRMVYDRDEFAAIIQSATALKSYLNNCEAIALYLKYIEITKEFEDFLRSVEADCDKFWAIEIEKQNKLRQQERWESLCKNGCGNCKNLCYNIDQPICNKTGAELREMNSPTYSGNALRLFNLVPMPAQNCPYAV